MANNDICIIGLDIGNKTTEAFTAQGSAITRTYVNYGDLNMVRNTTLEGSTYGDNREYTIDDNQYIVGPDVAPCGTQSDYWYRSQLRTIAGHYAAQMVGCQGVVNAMVTVPPHYYYDQNFQKQTATLEALIKTLKTPVVLQHHDGQTTFLKVDIAAEGMAASFTYLLDEEGHVRPEAKDTSVFVIDIGSNDTTLYGASYDALGRTTVKVATAIDKLGQAHAHARIKTQLLALIQEKTGIILPPNQISEQALIAAIESGQYKVQGNVIKIKDLVKKANHWLLGQIKAAVNVEIGHASEYDTVLLCGGYMQTLIEQDYDIDFYPNQKIHENPIMANAQGAYNLAKAKARIADKKSRIKSAA